MNNVIALFASIPLFLSSSFGKVVDIANSTFFQSAHQTETISIPTGDTTVNRISIQTEVNKYRSEKKLNTFISDSEVCKIANRLTTSGLENIKLEIENYHDLCLTCNSLGAMEATTLIPPSTMVINWTFNPNTSQTLMGDYKYGCAAIDLGRVIYITANKNLAVTTTKTLTAPITQINTPPSRTGQIIKYHEWCTNKDINIYQNELITKVSSDGKTYSMTQGDWDCYEKSLQQNKSPNNSNSVSTTNTTQYAPCYVYWPTLKRTETYLSFSPQECADATTKANSFSTTTPYIAPTIIPYVAPTPDPEAIQRCLDVAKSTLDNSKLSCSYKARGYGITSSTWHQQCDLEAIRIYDIQRAKCK